MYTGYRRTEVIVSALLLELIRFRTNSPSTPISSFKVQCELPATRSSPDNCSRVHYQPIKISMEEKQIELDKLTTCIRPVALVAGSLQFSLLAAPVRSRHLLIQCLLSGLCEACSIWGTEVPGLACFPHFAVCVPVPYSERRFCTNLNRCLMGTTSSN